MPLQEIKLKTKNVSPLSRGVCFQNVSLRAPEKALTACVSVDLGAWTREPLEIWNSLLLVY